MPAASRPWTRAQTARVHIPTRPCYLGIDERSFHISSLQVAGTPNCQGRNGSRRLNASTTHARFRPSEPSTESATEVRLAVIACAADARATAAPSMRSGSEGRLADHRGGGPVDFKPPAWVPDKLLGLRELPSPRGRATAEFENIREQLQPSAVRDQEKRSNLHWEFGGAARI